MMIRNGYMTYIALYIDDLLIISENDDNLVEIKRRLMEKFEMKDLNIAKKFLEMKIEYSDDNSIKLHQDTYIQSLLKHHDMQDCNSVIISLDISVKLIKIIDAEVMMDLKKYHFIIEGFIFVVIVIKLNIIYAIDQLSQFNNNSFSKHL